MRDTKEIEANEYMLDAIDEYIGSRIRMRRNILGLSQDELSRMLKISFQQIQKYEKGNNRISGSRIWQMGRALSIPVSYFFDGIEHNLRFKGIEVEQYAGDCLCDSEDDIEMPEIPSNKEERVKELIKAFITIDDETLSSHILEMTKHLANKPPKF